MSQPVPLARPLYKQLLDVKSIFFYLLVLAFVFSAVLIFAFWLDGWTLWLLGLLILAAWTPFVFSTMRAIYQHQPWFAFLYLLVIAQFAHMLEHLSQMVELHMLGWVGPKASGIIGFLNTEWVHLLWNSWVLLAAALLLCAYKRNVWLWILFLFAIYHEVEHLYIVSIYVRTGIAGNPGLLAQGGLIGGGLPIKRPDLHAIYAVLEEATLLMIYFGERRKLRLAEMQPVGAVQLSTG
ncbi:MAG TPA: hypothetical protein VGD98_12530 [Ktedonobacteraceae bacterium]